MRIIRNAEEARRTLLARKPLETEQLPMNLRETTFRTFGQELDPEEVVRRIIRDVREDGDNAVKFYNTKLDGAVVEDLRVTDEEIRDAYLTVDNDVVEALKFAAGRIRDYHEQQMRGASFDFNVNGPRPDHARHSACGYLHSRHPGAATQYGAHVRHPGARRRRRRGLHRQPR
ncbi:MAG: histidinol dehydrogenase [Dehalococcoidia bacterium]|nr:histidinol dehydrogenase [Dehalococcoidia bacterium]